MTTALEGSEGSASRPGRSLPPGKTLYPLYRRLGGPQGRSGQVRKISPPPGFDPRTVQPVACRYTDYSTLGPPDFRYCLVFSCRYCGRLRREFEYSVAQLRFKLNTPDNKSESVTAWTRLTLYLQEQSNSVLTSLKRQNILCRYNRGLYRYG